MIEEVTYQEPQQEPQQQDPPKKKLYNKLYGDGRYTKSYEDFEKQFSTPESINKLYTALNKSGSYTKTEQEFNDQFFKKKRTGTIDIGASSLEAGNALSGGGSNGTTPTTNDIPTIELFETDGDVLRTDDIVGLAQKSKELSQRTREQEILGNKTRTIVNIPDDKAIGESKKINKFLKERGYDASELSKEFSDFPTEAFELENTSKENLLRLRKENPIKYKEILNSTKTVFDIAKNSDIQTANLYNHLNDIKYGSLSEWENGKRQQQDIINRTLSGEKRDVALERLQENASKEINVLDRDLLNEYAGSPYKTLIDANQFAGLKTLQLFQPEKYDQAIKILGSKKPAEYEGRQSLQFTNEGFKMGDSEQAETEESINYKKGLESVKKGLADIGRNNAVRYAQKYKMDIESAAKNAQPEQMPELQQEYERYQSLLNDVRLDASKDEERYPLLAQMKFDDDVKEFTNDPKMNALQYGLFRFGKGFEKSGHTVNNLLTSMFGSEDDVTNLNAETIGRTLSDNSDAYLPTNLQSVQPEVIYKYPKEMTDARDSILKNKDLSESQKDDQIRNLWDKNKDKVETITNPNAGKHANLWSKSTLYGNAGMLGDIASIAAQSYGVGALGSGRLLSNALPMFLTSQDDFYKQAISEGKSNSEALSYANTHALIMAAAGLINPKLDIVKRSLGGNTVLGKTIAGISEKTWEAAVKKNSALIQRLTNSGMAVAKEYGKLAAVYGAGTSIAGDIVDNLVYNKNNSASDIIDHAVQSTKELTLHSLALLGISAITNAKATTPFEKARIWEAGTNKDISLKQIDDAVTAGQLTTAKAEQYKKVINETAKLIEKVPVNNDKGKPLTDKERVDYLYNSLINSKAKEEASNLPEKQAQKMDHAALVAEFKNQIILDQNTIGELNKKQEKLEKDLIPEKDADGKNVPIKETEKLKLEAELEAVKESIKEKESGMSVTKPTESSEPTTVSAKEENVFESLAGKNEFTGMDAEQTAKMIAEQAQSISADGKPLESYGVDMKAQMESKYGKEVVDAAIAKYPKEGILNTKLGTSQVKKNIEDFSKEDEFYRIVVGDKAFEDIVKTGEVRTGGREFEKNPVEGTKSITLTSRPTRFPSFSKGKASIIYAYENPNHYIIESSDPNIKPSTLGRHGKGKTNFPTDGEGNYVDNYSAKNVNVYKHLGEGKYELVYQKGKLLNEPPANTTFDPISANEGAAKEQGNKGEVSERATKTGQVNAEYPTSIYKLETKELDKLANDIPNGGEIKKYLSGDTIKKYEEGAELRNSQEIIAQELEPALKHGIETVNKAKELFGDNYVEKTLDYIAAEKLNPENKALLYVSLENDLANRVQADPNNLGLKKLQDLVRTESQAYLRSNSLAINMGRLRKFAEVGYDISKVTDGFFSSKEIEHKAKIEKDLQADADRINKEAEVAEKEGGLTTEIEQKIKEGVDREINEIYKKLPSRRRVAADKAIKSLEDIQKKLRGRTYDATAGIPVAIIDAGITTIKNAIKVGVGIADAIELGINKIKEKYGKEWANEDKFRSDITEEFKTRGVKDDAEFNPRKYVKEALIKEGFGRTINISTREGAKKVEIVDWKKLAGAEGSINKIKGNVEKSLNKDFSKEEIAEYSKGLIDEYNKLRRMIVNRGLKEIADRNKTTVSPEQKSAAAKLVDMYNYGLFEKDPIEYETTLAKTIGVEKLNEGRYKQVKDLGDAMTKLFSSSFNGKRLNEREMKSAIQVVEEKMRIILNSEAKNHGSGWLKAADMARTWMDATQRMTLNNLKQAVENTFSGLLESLYSSLSTGSFGMPKELASQRIKSATDIYRNMFSEGGTTYGDVSSTFVNKGNLEMYANKIAGSDKLNLSEKQAKWFQRVASTLLGRTTLDAVDSFYKSKITQQKFTYNLFKILTKDRLIDGKIQKAMSKQEAKEFLAEKLTGQTFKDAQTTAREIIDKVNAGKDKKILNDSKLFVDRLANDIVTAALVNGEKITPEMVTAAYNAGYRAAGRGLGHVANNFISKQVGNVTGEIEKKINDAIKEKDYNKAAGLTLESIFFRNIANPFVGGGTNWVVLKMEKTGLGLLSGLGSMMKRGAKMDLTSEAGIKNLEDAMYENLKIKDKFIRGAIGGAMTGLAALSWLGITSTDEYRKWRKKNAWASRYLDTFTPEVILAMMASKNGEMQKYLANTANKNDAFSKETKLLNAANAATKGDYTTAKGQTGEVIGNTIGFPIPWRLVRDGQQIWQGASGGEVYKVNGTPSQSFMEGYFKGGLMDYMGLDKWAEYDRDDLNTLIFRNTIVDPKEQEKIVNNNDGGRTITDKEFEDYNKAKEQIITPLLTKVHNEGYPVVRGGVVAVVPYKEMTKEEIKDATNDIKSYATRTVKETMFGGKEETDEEKEANKELRELKKSYFGND